MHRRWTLRSRGHRVAAALLLAGTISLAGFGATISLASPTAESNGKTALTQRMLSSLYTGPRLHIPAGPSPAVRGKTIGVVTLTSASEVFPRELAAIRAAAKVLGWTVKQANMNGDVSQAGPAVENLLQEGVSGIITQSVEPNLFGAQAVADAKAKHVPIVSTFSGYVASDSKGVFAGSITSDFTAIERALDKHIVSDIGAGGQIALLNDVYASEGRIPEVALRKDLAGKADIVATHQMNYANLVPDAFATVSAWLTQYPNLKAVWCPYDGACVGAAQAIQAAHKSNVEVFSIDGVTSIINFIRQGEKITTAAEPLEYSNWLAVDQLNSIFGHRKFTPTEDVPGVIVDPADVPKTGVIDGSQIYGNYVSAFKHRWGISG